MIGRRLLEPYVRLFPIWRHGARFNLFGERLADGWYPERFGTREIHHG